MIRIEFVQRKLHLITQDLIALIPFKDDTLEDIAGDFIKLAAVERLLERIVMRALDINLHLLAELTDASVPQTSRLTYRDSFLKLADQGVYPEDFAAQISKSAGLRNRLLHDYNDVDQSIVHGAIRFCIKEYKDYVDFLNRFLTTLNKV